MGCKKLIYYNYDQQAERYEFSKYPNVNKLTSINTTKKVRRAYVYGWNKQSRTDEVAGSGNHYTAPFWEYSPRTVHRWNLDPKPNSSMSPYAILAGNPIMYTDHLGDTIKRSASFEANEGAMKSYDEFMNSRAGKRFEKRYGAGGKRGTTNVTFDLFTEKEENSSSTSSNSAFTQTFGGSRKLGLGDKLEKGEDLSFRIALNSTSSFSTPKQIRSGALTLLHETQHLRIIDYGFLMTNTYKYSSSQQHYMMRTNLRQGSEYKVGGKKYFLNANGIYDFNAERWQFLDEKRFKGETNEDIEREIGGFMNY